MGPCTCGGHAFPRCTSFALLEKGPKYRKSLRSRRAGPLPRKGATAGRQVPSEAPEVSKVPERSPRG